jgi:hypothetical protein
MNTEGGLKAPPLDDTIHLGDFSEAGEKSEFPPNHTLIKKGK